MITFDNTQVVGWEAAIRGMRNPMNSWEKSDSGEMILDCNEDIEVAEYITDDVGYVIGPNDLSLMKKLRDAGTDHRKFMRMIVVYVDILAPLYWWKEFDTYRAGVKYLDDPNPFDIEMNSCSTMHCIHKKEFTLDDFSCEYLDWTDAPEENYESGDILSLTVKLLNINRNRYNEAANRLKTMELSEAERKYISSQKKHFWYNMIQLLPTSYNQKRTVMLNYEVLANIYESRRGHKLDEWNDFRRWIFAELPYSELITGCTESISG